MQSIDYNYQIMLTVAFNNIIYFVLLNTDKGYCKLTIIGISDDTAMANTNVSIFRNYGAMVFIT